MSGWIVISVHNHFLYNHLRAWLCGGCIYMLKLQELHINSSYRIKSAFTNIVKGTVGGSSVWCLCHSYGFCYYLTLPFVLEVHRISIQVSVMLCAKELILLSSRFQSVMLTR